tara:strand:- start:722 stop:907 length:186 start_codon:yes stop_codon:yes gene_type:complete
MSTKLEQQIFLSVARLIDDGLDMRDVLELSFKEYSDSFKQHLLDQLKDMENRLDKQASLYN